MPKELEIVSYLDRPAGFVTVQLALRGKLVAPFTVEKPVFWAMQEQERQEFLERSARTMLDIYGDARDGQVLSDGEVQARTRM